MEKETGVESGIVVFKGDAGLSGLSILVGSLAFRVHELEIVVQGNTVGIEYGVEHVVCLCSTDNP